MGVKDGGWADGRAGRVGWLDGWVDVEEEVEEEDLH